MFFNALINNLECTYNLTISTNKSIEKILSCKTHLNSIISHQFCKIRTGVWYKVKSRRFIRYLYGGHPVLALHECTQEMGNNNRTLLCHKTSFFCIIREQEK